mmetsp:Transcript_10454/g.43278  ORF Transcript_10454/g.43278 Transcript_10454/m.43278 type:complete len:343 (+) Transcript_10454:2484-3512(+)
MTQRVDDVFPFKPEIDHHLQSLGVDVRGLRQGVRRGHDEVPREVHDVPRVRANLRYRDSLERVHEQHSRNEIARARRQVRGEVVYAPLDLLEQVRDGLVVEGEGAAQERVQDHPARPHVHLRTAVELTGDNLRRGVVRRPARRLQKVPVPHHVAQAKVRDLHVGLGVQQEVLGLEIAVDHHVAVAVLDAGDDLLKEVSRLVLAETTLLHDVVEELAALDVLHDHVDVVRGLEDLIQADDVRVHEQPQDLDLPANLLLHVDGLDLLAVQDLDGHLVPGEDVLGHLDLAEGADPERLAHPVVREVYLCHRSGPALDGAITPRVRIRRGLGHVSLASENSTRCAV